jgi:hypothetical protein
MTAADILPASATCIPCARAHARIVSDWPGGATLGEFGSCPFAVAEGFLAAAGLAFRATPFAVALFETDLLVAEAFDGAAFAAVSGSAALAVAGPVVTDFRVVACLGGAFLAVVFRTVAFRAAAFLVRPRRLEPFASLGAVDGVRVLALSGSAGTPVRARCFRLEVARSGLSVEVLPCDPKASATTASASSNVS